MKHIKRAAILSLSVGMVMVPLAGCSDNNVTNPGPGHRRSLILQVIF